MLISILVVIGIALVLAQCEHIWRGGGGGIHADPTIRGGGYIHTEKVHSLCTEGPHTGTNSSLQTAII